MSFYSSVFMLIVFFFSISPLMMGLSLALMALAVSMLIMAGLSKWWALIVVVVFLGGVMVMFFYITSVAKSEKAYMKMAPMMVAAAAPAALWPLTAPQGLASNIDLMGWLYASGSEAVVLFLTAILLTVLLFIVKMCNTCKGSLSKKF